ncbi:hypothetical protein PPL_09206 [Heterostelium album PN500]|uniref:Uncharacterized protein n=1 Tax=Heterostelium pallidum (strain ATCC 26659 / Pp 5 / PN500) TaxID=670386 RepID=D3BKX4_HETP5|nr:hypothetical protein PPL_09206 [Heterostelium album PN500]EFA78554.1 hypothetical protein PPL_09206 [Heterostelium album PN500]|eukprot:XP_020430678.1 hypothetical protein PPL_09206 [Heterostelium album PN500]
MTFIKGVTYDPQVAKASVLQTKQLLVQLEQELNSSALSKEKVEDIFKQYQSLPITYQINWAVAGEDPLENQKKADFCRDKLNELNHEHHFTSNKIPRAFNADSGGY